MQTIPDKDHNIDDRLWVRVAFCAEGEKRLEAGKLGMKISLCIRVALQTAEHYRYTLAEPCFDGLHDYGFVERNKLVDQRLQIALLQLLDLQLQPCELFKILLHCCVRQLGNNFTSPMWLFLHD